MKKTVTIKRRYEFKMLFSKGKVYYGNHITIYILKNKLSMNKLGIAVSKKSGRAVDRNRVKRLIRENYKRLEDNLKYGYYILVSVNKKTEIRTIDFYDIQKDMKKAFQKSELWVEET